MSAQAVPTSRSNAAIVQQVYEAFGSGNVDALDAVLAPDVVDHGAAPDLPAGRDGVKGAVAYFLRAFPDTHFNVEATISDGELVAARYTLTGTHRGEFMDIAPTGRQVRVTGMDFFRVRDGRVVERWGELDELGLMQQLVDRRASSRSEPPTGQERRRRSR